MMNKFLKIAESLKPRLIETEVQATGEYGKPLKEGDTQIFDFGNHFVGQVSIKCTSVGSHQDAPAFIKIKFCESKEEIDEDATNYRGWVSKSWIQEEYIHIDVLPEIVKLPRRYAFRYVKIEVLGLSGKYNLVIDNISAITTTSADTEVKLSGDDEELRQIDKVSLRTLSECMQYEFEDGPKRDQRLWLGDLRLQALANYETFKNNDLVKRCLYLFAGIADEKGKISACLFTKPEIEADDALLFDYSLLFNATLLDYVKATNDLETGRELLPLAIKQIELAKEKFNDFHTMIDSDVLGWCFLDWNLILNKQAGAQAVYIYAAKQTVELCEILGVNATSLKEDISLKTDAAIKAFFDEKIGLFTSGKDKQVSYAANIWFCLAKVFDEKKNAEILKTLDKQKDAVKLVTPYMYHHYIQALIDCGEKEKAETVMRNYWGAMVEMGADTFYELFNPENPEESPYGGKVVNSYCHAWSCTPSYFIRKYFSKGE